LSLSSGLVYLGLTFGVLGCVCQVIDGESRRVNVVFHLDRLGFRRGFDRLVVAFIRSLGGEGAVVVDVHA
jgi:hypothetical protein